MKDMETYFVKRRNKLVKEREATQQKIDMLRKMLSEAMADLRFVDQQILEHEEAMPMSMFNAMNDAPYKVAEPVIRQTKARATSKKNWDDFMRDIV